MKLYVVKDGVPEVGHKSFNDAQVKDGTFYLLTYDFKSNVGYIGKRAVNEWRLYTTVGSKQDLKSRYHHFSNLIECVHKLQELSPNVQVKLIESFENKEAVVPVNFGPKSSSSAIEATPKEKELSWLISIFQDKRFSLTKGAEYKLELLLEEVHIILEKTDKFNDKMTIVEEALANYSRRISQLQEHSNLSELNLIRPEDIPNLE